MGWVCFFHDDYAACGSHWGNCRVYWTCARGAISPISHITNTGALGERWACFMVVISRLSPMIRYYLNPTPNSRNVEFDPKQNLLKSLDPLEQVDAP